MKSPEKDNTPYRDLEFDSEYIGNIWGWKFSMFGLALIVILSVLMFWRHEKTGTAPGFEKMETPADKLFKTKEEKEMEGKKQSLDKETAPVN